MDAFAANKILLNLQWVKGREDCNPWRGKKILGRFPKYFLNGHFIRLVKVSIVLVFIYNYKNMLFLTKAIIMVYKRYANEQSTSYSVHHFCCIFIRRVYIDVCYFKFI